MMVEQERVVVQLQEAVEVAEQVKLAQQLQVLVVVRVVVVVMVVVQDVAEMDYKTILELALTSGMQVEEAAGVET